MHEVGVVERLFDTGEGFAIEMPMVDTWSGPVHLLNDYFYEHLELRDQTWRNEVAAAVAQHLSDPVQSGGDEDVPDASNAQHSPESTGPDHLGDLFNWVVSEHPRFAPDQFAVGADRGGYQLAQQAYTAMKSMARRRSRIRGNTASKPDSAVVRQHQREGRWARASLVDRLRDLGLHGMASEWAGMKRDRASPWPREVALIDRLLTAERRYRETTSSAQMLLDAGFPLERDLKEFDFDRASVDRENQSWLLSMEFTSTHENVAIVGGSRTGKTHLAIAIGRQAVLRYGKRTRYFTVSALADDLQRELEAGRAGTMGEELSHLDLLILDGLGCQPLNATERVLVFQLLSFLSGKTSVMVTSSFERHEWFGLLGAVGMGLFGESLVLFSRIVVKLYASAEAREEAENIEF